MIIAIDGPSGSGKSSVARLVAQKLGLAHIDTGATYRAVGVLAQRKGLPPENEKSIAKLASNLDFRFENAPDGTQRLLVNGEDLTQAIRTQVADEWAAKVANLPSVRRALVAAQRRLGEKATSGVVVEGRDIQTVVFPEAKVKVFLTASSEERARRRLRDIQSRGEKATFEEVIQKMEERDRLDETRALGPLRKAPDAVEIRTDGLTAEEVAEQIATLARQKMPLSLGRTTSSRPLVGGINLHGRHPLYYLARTLFRLIFKVLGRWKVEGKENLPCSGGVILAPNHISYADPPLVSSATGRKAWFMAKSELFEIPILGPILPRVCTYPVKRGKPDREALRTTLELLAHGEVVTIFPEGARSPDGKLKEPELGIALVALHSGAPVVPMGLIDSDRLLPRHSPIPRFAHVIVRIGKPLYFGHFRDKRWDRATREQVATEIMSALAELTGQEPVNLQKRKLAPT